MIAKDPIGLKCMYHDLVLYIFMIHNYINCSPDQLLNKQT